MAQSDLDTALAALARERSVCVGPDGGHRSARANRRAALGLVLVGLLVAAGIDLSMASPPARDTLAKDSRASTVFANAESGTCLSWPLDEPEKPSFVQCSSDHVFEVAKTVVMDNFAEPCQRAVQEYLGARYDPNSRFTSSVLWAGDTGAQPSDRRLLCGLQLLGVDGKPVPFKGVVAELDQSKVWPAGTCLGADEAARRATDLPIDCTQPHGAQVTGTVNLAERFPAAVPTEAEQDVFVREECTRMSNAYLAPKGLAESGLTLEFTPIARVSWAAGSRQVACRVAPQPGAGWRPLVGSLAPRQSDIQTPEPPPPSPVSAQAPVPTTAETTTAPPSAPLPSPTPSASPTATPTTTEPSSAPATTPTVPPDTTSATPTATLGPLPGPAAAEAPSAEALPPNVIQIPGLEPITLPVPAPEPPPPAPLP